MPDYTVGDTVYKRFTTRAFATGIPTTLAGTPVVSAYEDDSATQITAGITLGVDHDSVGGLNLLTIVATGGNGFEAGKSYDLVITTGTVGGVSVVGEVVWHFTLSAEAAAVDLANGTDGLGAIKADTAATLADTGTDGVIIAAGQTVATVTTLTGHTAQTGDNFARIGPTGSGLTSVAQASVATESRLAELDAGNLPADIAAIPTTAMRGTDDAATAANLATVDGIVDSILALLDDPRAEPGQGAPAVNANLATKIDYLYKWRRNTFDNDGSVNQYFNDAGTVVDQKETTSEAAGTVTVGEMVSGP